jgi:hypothetical protein
VRRADYLTTFMCRLSTNLGTSTSWTPQGLSRRVMGLLYLLLPLFVVTTSILNDGTARVKLLYVLVKKYIVR